MSTTKTIRAQWSVIAVPLVVGVLFLGLGLLVRSKDVTALWVMLGFAAACGLWAASLWAARIEILADGLRLGSLTGKPQHIPFASLERIAIERGMHNGTTPYTLTFHFRVKHEMESSTVQAAHLAPTSLRPILEVAALQARHLELNHLAEEVRCGRVSNWG